ncbi:MAG TPA: hypothetical protein VFL86_00960 [Burkholderiaceae bacterium]|nr:hypothetical protein [Burkholderiaceae bacterium]
MGFSNIGGGGGMNINLNVGGVQGGVGAQGGGDIPALQLRFDNAKDRLDRNRGDSDAQRDLRDLKKDVDNALHKESSKEDGGNSIKQEMLEQLLNMIMQLLQQILGGDEAEGDKDNGHGSGGSGGGGGGGKKKHPAKGQGPSVQITITTK